MSVLTTFGPKDRAPDCLADDGLRGVGWRAFVEHHRDVGPQILLDADGPLRGQVEQGPVDVRPEGDAAVGHLADLGQAEHLESAGVGEDGPVPAHELVEPAEFGDQLVAGPQGQVVSVAEKDVSPDGPDLFGSEALDRSLRADRHEDRGLDGPVGRVESAAAGGTIGRVQGEAEGHGEKKACDPVGRTLNILTSDF